MKRIIFIIMIMINLALITACSSIQIKSPTELIRRPKLEIDQEKIRQVVEQILPEKTKLLSVIQDNQLGAINFADIDADGVDEAIVFYKSVEKDYLLGLMVLKHTADGWIKFDEKNEVANDIDFISVSDTTGNGVADLLVGFTGDDEFEKYLVVYSMENGEINRIFEEKYENILISDFENRGTNDLVITQIENNINAKIKLYRGKNGEINLIDELKFSDYVNRFDAIKATKINNTKGFVVDYTYGNYAFVSTIVEVKNGELKDLLSDESKVDYYSQKYKPYYIESTDIDGDDVVEIGNYIVPQVQNDSNDAGIVLIEEWYNWLNGNSLEKVKRSYSDENYNYRFIFPEKWIDKDIKVDRIRSNDSEDKIQILMFNAKKKTYEIIYSVEIFKTSIWQEKRNIENLSEVNYTELLNDIEYTYIISESDDFKLSEEYELMKLNSDELKECFKLLK